jgi:protein SCO1/2
MNRTFVQIFARTTIACCLAILLARAPRAAARGVITPEPPPRTAATPDELKNVTLDEHLNGPLPLDAKFVDDTNQPVQLRKYFTGKKPVVLQLGYYGCPMLCDLVSRGATTSLKELPLTAGKDFELVFISIDPNESWQLAQGKKRSWLREYDRPGTAAGWHFLTGKADDIEAVAKAVGFNYKWVPSVGQFSHPAGLILCTPEGKISRYLYGVRFEQQTLRLSLVEASEGKVGTTTDRFLLTCFQYDGHQGKYAFAAMALMRLGGIVTVIVLAVVVITLFRREARRRRDDPQPPIHPRPHTA